MSTTTSIVSTLELESVPKLKSDITRAAKLLPKQEIRYLVDTYYAMQDARKVAKNQERALAATKEPHEVMTWLGSLNTTMEGQIKRVLNAWAQAQQEGEWLYSIVGIGPITSSGLMAHVDIIRCPHASHIWSFAGLSTRQHWLGAAKATVLVNQFANAGMSLEEIAVEGAVATGMQANTIMRFASTDKEGKPVKLTKESLAKAIARRPWNATFRTLCWNMGEVFCKFSAHPEDIYGKIWLKWKAYETQKNYAGDFADKALAIAKDNKISRSTDAWLYNNGCLTAEKAQDIKLMPAEKQAAHLRKVAGVPGSGVPMLTPGHLHSRAKRYAVKMFLSHYHEVAYTMHYKQAPAKHYKQAPAKPYVFVEHEGSAHVPHDILGYIPPPNWDKATQTVVLD